MWNSIRYNIILPFSPLLPQASRKQWRSRKGRGWKGERAVGAEVHFRAGREGRKHVQNHYQPRRDGVALMGRRPFFQPLEIYPTPFFRRCIFHYTPPRTRGPRPLTLADLRSSKQARNSQPSAPPRLRYTLAHELLTLTRVFYLSLSLPSRQPSVSNLCLPLQIARMR